ncbi:DNA-3-methyladenine glycosylase 2 family protein, partial [Clavibacter michiganensis]
MTAPDARTTYLPDREVDLRLVLRPLFRGVVDPTCRWDAAPPGSRRVGVWRTARTPLGDASLRLD